MRRTMKFNKTSFLFQQTKLRYVLKPHLFNVKPLRFHHPEGASCVDIVVWFIYFALKIQLSL